MTDVTLNRTGDKMPTIGFGCWKIPRADTATAVFNAIKAGYRHLDCACDYGNEKQVGEGIKRAMDAGLVTRKDLFVTSKLWNTYHAAEHVLPACKRSLSDLGLEYLDMYLIHFPISLKFVPFETRYPPEWIFDPDSDDPKMEYAPVPVSVTWGAMEGLVKDGLCRNIGVSNFNVQLLTDLLSYCNVKPGTNQVESHPYNTQTLLKEVCDAHDIRMTAFSPLGAGSYVELGMATMRESAMEEPIIKCIADHHNKSPAQVLLKWGVQRGTVVIPKSVRESRMIENLDVNGFTLGESEMAAIFQLNKSKRFNDPGVFCVGMKGLSPIYD